MQKRLYSLAAILTISVAIIISTTELGKDKFIEVEYTQLTKDAKKQVDCLAENIYFEAAYEPTDGKIAVAMVTLNRVQDPRYPKDICSVVKQRVKSTCQFSWYCESGKKIQNSSAYNQARKVALLVYANYEKMPDVSRGALFYHADYVNPRWKLEKTIVIGRHIFYKERSGT
jgi:spore germination cell wall hydrolase CwlJ-like protein